MRFIQALSFAVVFSLLSVSQASNKCADIFLAPGSAAEVTAILERLKSQGLEGQTLSDAFRKATKDLYYDREKAKEDATKAHQDWVASIRSPEVKSLISILKGSTALTSGPRPETLDHYIATSETRQSRVTLPSFTSAERDVQASKTWTAEKGQRMIQEAMPNGVGLISHALYGAMAPGLVKADATGSFVSARATVSFRRHNGQVEEVSTNVGFNIGAMVSNIGKAEGQRYLVPADAQAVIISLHGGGTKGTGHHTAVEQVNTFGAANIGVISVEGPWHGEGPRTHFRNVDEYFDYLAALIDKYVPPELVKGKKVYLMGHSWGGQLADMAMRRTDNPNFRLGQQIGMFFPLSPVADPAPGKSQREKFLAAVQREKDQRTKHWDDVAEGDKELTDSLIGGDKISPMAMFGYTWLSLGQEWAVPAHGGAKYTPALTVSGRGDFTLVGYQDLYNANFHNLKNVTPLVMGRRKTFYSEKRQKAVESARQAARKAVQENPSLANDPATRKALDAPPDDGMEVTGHLVQDNYKPETVPPEYQADPRLMALYNRMKPTDKEVYGAVRAAIELQLGIELGTANPQTDSALIRQVYLSTLNNLAFREFAKDFEYFKIIPKDGGRKTQELNGVLSGALKELSKIDQNKGLSSEEKAEKINARLVALNQQAGLNIKSLQEYHQLRDENFGKMTHVYVPDGPNKEAAEANIAKRKDLEDVRKNATERKDAALAQLRGKSANKGKEKVIGLIDQRRGLEKSIQGALADAGVKSPVYTNAKSEMDAAFKKQWEQDQKVRELMDEFLLQCHEKQLNPGTTPWPTELRQAIDLYDALSREHQKLKQQLARVTESEGVAGNLGAEVKALYDQLNALRRQIETLQSEVNQMEYVGHRATIEGFKLIHEYVTQIVPGNFEVRSMKLNEVLDLDPSQWNQYIWVLQPAWSRWATLWGERPPPEKAELY